MLFTVEDLQKDLQLLIQRKDETLQTFHQLVGAVSVIEQQLNKLLAPEPEAETVEPENEECEKEPEIEPSTLADLHAQE